MGPADRAADPDRRVQVVPVFGKPQIPHRDAGGQTIPLIYGMVDVRRDARGELGDVLVGQAGIVDLGGGGRPGAKIAAQASAPFQIALVSLNVANAERKRKRSRCQMLACASNDCSADNINALLNSSAF